MKRTLLILLCAVMTHAASGTHLLGGELVYDYLGPGAQPDYKKYKITLKLYRDVDCSGCQLTPFSVNIHIFTVFPETFVTTRYVLLEKTEVINNLPWPRCISNPPPSFNYAIGYYSFTIELRDRLMGYTMGYQSCCRREDISNIPPVLPPDPPVPWDGASSTIISGSIPGFLPLAGGGGNTTIRPDRSPVFKNEFNMVCANRPFELDFSAVDPDGDLLTYAFCTSYEGFELVSYGNTINPPQFWKPSFYTPGFSGASPLGPDVTIDPNTGIISGVAPNPGRYLVSVCVTSINPLAIGINDPKIMTVTRREFVLTVSACDLPGAFLKPEYLFCGSLTVDLANLNESMLNESFNWDFGDGNTSTDQFPTHTYNTPGIYDVRLIVNEGTPCVDTAYTKIKVYPGFIPEFDYPATTCKDVPINLKDLSTTFFGNINYWEWSIPSYLSSNDQHVVFPGFEYTGTYSVSLIVGTSFGCRDTVTHDITITNKPPYALTNDTLICNIDTIGLRYDNLGTGIASITWSPNYMINDVNSFAPLVSPDVTTTYYADYTETTGCSIKDSVVVKVVDRVSISSVNDTTICRTDTLLLRTVSDGLQYSWTPVATLNNAALQSPVATPVDPVTNYHLIARIGKCIGEEDIVIRTVPYPAANAGPDSTICLGNSIQLHASGGSIYSWSPRIFLDNSNIPGPVSQNPLQDIEYVVTVKDVLGCPKAVNDTMRLTVADIKADAGPASMNVVLGQPVNLLATGSTNYEWTPATWLSNPHVANPVALPQQSIRYTVKVSNAQGCFDTDTISLKLFNIAPDLLVPTAFSPNNDGINDVFRPIAVGMKSLNSFRIYNRWGQLLFAGSRQNDGWDGSLKGMPQAAGTYVWEATGITYQDKVVKKKGTVTLIR